MPICSTGHESQTDDFCDVCGTRLTGDASSAPSERTVPAPTVGGAAPPIEAASPDGVLEPCPVCQAPRSDRFCEACGYDFTPGQPDPGPPGAVPAPSPPTAAWTAVVAADHAYYDRVVSVDDGILFPPYCPERQIALDAAEVQIGRRRPSKGIHPHIDLTGPPEDPGVSHLHAVLIAQDDGSWHLIDPGSTNGTHLNDDPQPIPTNVPMPVADGDRIHLGAWTTIRLRRNA